MEKRFNAWKQRAKRKERQGVSDTILELKHITKTFPGVRALDDVALRASQGRDPRPHGRERRGQIHPHQGHHGRLPARFRPDPPGRQERLDPRPPGLAEARHRRHLPARDLLPGPLRNGEHLHRPREGATPSPARSTGRTCTPGPPSSSRASTPDFGPRAVMGSLSVAQQQIVEIAKALSANARIIIMDEPTAPLTKRESEDLYRIAEGLRDKGVSIIFISHRLEDMYRLASRVTVFRDARYVGHLGRRRDQPRRTHRGHGRPLHHAALPQAQGGDRGGGAQGGGPLADRLFQGRFLLRPQGRDPRDHRPRGRGPHRGLRGDLRHNEGGLGPRLPRRQRAARRPPLARPSRRASATFPRTGSSRGSSSNGLSRPTSPCPPSSASRGSAG